MDKAIMSKFLKIIQIKFSHISYMKWIITTCLLCSLGSLIFISLQEKNFFVKKTLQAVKSVDQNDLKILNEKYETLQQQLKTLQENQQLIKDTLTQDIQPDLEKLQNHVPARDQTVWILAEAHYLAQLAYQRMYVMRDVENSVKLLELADQKIQTIKDSQYLPIREALKYDVTKLKAIHMPDLAGIWFTITTLLEDAQQLTVLSPGQAFMRNNAHQLEQSKVKSEGWRGILKKSLLSIKDLMRIRHHDKPVDTKLFVIEPGFAIERLRLLLEQVRWAALNENPDIYSKSILQSRKWLSDNFDASDTNMQYMIETLSALEVLDIKPVLPEVLSSVRALNEAMKRL